MTNNKWPDFGICDLETLAIATRIKDLKVLLKKRMKQRHLSMDLEEAFKQLNNRYCDEID